MTGYDPTFNAGVPKCKTLDEYIEFKLKMLKEDFGFNLTPVEIDRVRSMKTHATVDSACRRIIFTHLDN